VLLVSLDVNENSAVELLTNPEGPPVIAVSGGAGVDVGVDVVVPEPPPVPLPDPGEAPLEPLPPVVDPVMLTVPASRQLFFSFRSRTWLKTSAQTLTT
jgi:hypothetical protein